MRDKRIDKRNALLTTAAIALTVLLLIGLNMALDNYQMRIFNLCGIYIILALSMILINGFLGLFSLGHAGFMAIGAYTCALLTMDPAIKQMNFFLSPMVPWLANQQWPFLPAILLGGVLAAVAGFLIGAPVLRLKDDYLAIATLGFAEIIRIIFTNTQSLTNGSLGIKGIETISSRIPLPGGIELRMDVMWWIWILAIITVVFMVRLIRGSYGKAFMAIREDEIAAEAMGINVFRHKLLAFVIASFLAGVGGALLGNLLGTIDPLMFRFLLTYNIVMVVVLGGIGSITGGVLSAIVVTILMEALRFLDGAFEIGPIAVPGMPGLRMVVFSILLMLVIIYRPKGLMGAREFSWDWFLGIPASIRRLSSGKRTPQKGSER